MPGRAPIMFSGGAKTVPKRRAPERQSRTGRAGILQRQRRRAGHLMRADRLARGDRRRQRGHAQRAVRRLRRGQSVPRDRDIADQGRQAGNHRSPRGQERMGHFVSPSQVTPSIRIGRDQPTEGAGAGWSMAAIDRKRAGLRPVGTRPAGQGERRAIVRPAGRLVGPHPSPVVEPLGRSGRDAGRCRLSRRVVAVGGHDADPLKERRHTGHNFRRGSQ